MESLSNHGLGSISIERLPLSEQVYMTLKKGILTGTLEPGVKLNEVRIAEELQVSPTPVREAFRKLAKDNLVVIKPWKGVTVKGYSPEEIVSMYQCREVMEGLGARLCAEVASDEQLREVAEAYQTCVQSTDVETRVAANNHFHSSIMLLSGNERIVDYLSSFTEMVNRDMYISSMDKQRMVKCDEEHKQILYALQNHDGDAAEKAMRYHIRNAFVYKRAHGELAGRTK
ncbi:MAG: GntR family transcriptional regulator [Veillonellaceae bacterium]|nr:GntR family transcriptional regulator [Veillonellaceae bacterium]